MSALSQQYDEAQYHLSQINSSIATTKANVAADQQQVVNDRATLSKAAVANYISDGSAAAQNPIFSGNEKALGATTEYNKIAEGDISLAVANLHTAENSLNAQVSQLQGEQSQAQTQVTVEQNAVNQNAQAVQQQKNALAQEQGRSRSSSSSSSRRKPPPPPGPRSNASRLPPQPPAGGSRPEVRGCLAGRSAARACAPPSSPAAPGAVQAAKLRIGIPYVWGGESPEGSANTRDSTCLGLTAWSWGQVGVSLPTSRGGQMADWAQSRSAISSPVISSSTAPAAPTTWPCTSVPAP